MKTKIEIKSVFGNVLFEYEKENNTVKNTVEKAVESDANLCGADLCSANLRGADLCSADLYGANLYGADLYGANLCSANLCSANLYGANLYGANLYGADLYGANLCSADLCSADLRDADLRDADLRDADLCGAKNTPFIPTYLPDGEFIAWKKLPNGLIAKLKILEDSKRSRSTSDKCRCDKCLVLEFQDMDGTKTKVKKYTSNQYAKCVYEVGKIVEADEWDEDRFNECSHGIHFFIDRQSAVNYK